MTLQATIRLLNSSTLVAISGAFRIYIAFLFIGTKANILTCIAGGLVIYAVYTLDRTLDCKEDTINRNQLTGSRKDIAFLVSISSFSIGTYILFMDGLYIISFVPLIIGYLYSKGIYLGKRRLKLKGDFGVKNLVVGLTWGTFISGIVQQGARTDVVLFSIFPFFAIKSFINTAVYDFRDVKGDEVAGLKTLPTCLGERRAQKLLQVIHILLHLWITVSMLLSFIKVEIIVLSTVWLTGMIYTSIYTRPPSENEPIIRKILRDVFVDGEFILAIFLRAITGF